MLLSIIVGILSACWAIIVFFLLTSRKEWNEDLFHMRLGEDELEKDLMHGTGPDED